MDTYAYDTVVFSKIAIHMAKKDSSYIDECISYLKDNNDESSCIKIANIVFSYFVSQFRISSTKEERDIVMKNAMHDLGAIFDDLYIPQECWNCLLEIRSGVYQVREQVEYARKMIDLLDVMRFPITTKYIYRKVANYIINGNLFFVEPYTTTLEKVVSVIDGEEFDLSEQPTFLT